jgi:hypothetical protein
MDLKANCAPRRGTTGGPMATEGPGVMIARRVYENVTERLRGAH